MVHRQPGISDASQTSQAGVPSFSGPSYQENLWPKPPEAGPPHQFVSSRRLRVGFGLTSPYSESKRISYGLLWAVWTVVLTIAGFALLFSGSVFSGLLSLVLAFFAGRYDYRIWSWQAKRLLFFIVW